MAMAFIAPGPSRVSRLTILSAFGPLAAMHAALDRRGIGLPCSAAAFFPDRRADELERAISAAADHYPVLSSRLVWDGDQPLLEVGSGGPTGLSDPLCFRPDDTGIWGYRLTETAAGVWFEAAFVHAVADGPSMLRLLGAVAGELQGRSPEPFRSPARPPPRQKPMAGWLPGFLLEHARGYDGLAAANRCARAGSTFAILPPASAERLQQDAGRSGVAARLGAAAASSLLQQQRGRAEGEVYLNVPISRSAAAPLGGFGFDGSSVRFPLRLSRSDGLDDLAARAGVRLKARIAEGWDLNLARLLDGGGEKRMKFAAVQARKEPDPCLTVSWKPRIKGIGPSHGVSRAACFAAAPTLHLSAHAGEEGLSLSLTTPQEPGARRELLLEIIARLGLDEPGEIHELAALV